MVSLIPFTPALRTKRFLLTPFKQQDSKNLHHLINDWSVVRTLSHLPFPYPHDMVEGWIDMTIEEAQNGNAYYFAIVDEDSLFGGNKLLGCVGITLEKNNTQGRIGYWIGRNFWHKGIASECVHHVIKWAFAHLTIHKLYASVAEDNTASLKILQKNGFENIGQSTEKFIAYNKDYPVLVFQATRESFATSQQSMLLSPPPMPEQSYKMPLRSSHIPSPSNKPFVMVAAGILVDKNNKILLARRPEGKPMAGLWEFPGGKIEPSETPEAALIREMKEELGIDLATTCMAPFSFISQDYTHFHLLMTLFICRHWANTPIPQEKQLIIWCTADELKNYPMPEADKPLIPLLQELL